MWPAMAHAAHVVAVAHVHSGHAALLLALLPCVSKRRGQQRCSKDERQLHKVLQQHLKGLILFFVHGPEHRDISKRFLHDTAGYTGVQKKSGWLVIPQNAPGAQRSGSSSDDK
jgi:hypothetical protein